MKALKFSETFKWTRVPFLMETAFVILKKGDAANYANYQQGVTFWSIRVSVRWKLTHTVFNELITTRTLGHFFI